MLKELSLKGIARQHCGLNGDFSVLDDVFGSKIPGTRSMLAELKSKSSKEWSYTNSGTGCGGVKAKYKQTWTHVSVRIELKEKSGVTAADLNTLKPFWRDGIEDGWNNNHDWGCARSGELACRIKFEVEWVTKNQHFKIKVHVGPTRSNSRNWDTEDDAWTAAHEFGHLLGYPDEYDESECSLVNTGSIMDTRGSYLIPQRLMTRFAANIGSNVVAL